MKFWKCPNCRAGLQASRAVTANRQLYYQTLVNNKLSTFEQQHLSELGQAQNYQLLGQAAALVASLAALAPEVSLGLAGFGGSPTVSLSFGGAQLGAAATEAGKVLEMFAGVHAYNANMASIVGSWDRRSQEWGFQLQTATLELAQIDQQIAAAQIRVLIAQDDLNNHDLQIQNAQGVEDFLRSKYTNGELYGWMVDQTSTVYFQCYQMAYDLAKRLEAAFRFERGLSDSNYIQFGYWDSLRKGLLSGERLYLDLKRMELAYLEQNVREYEITKSVSLVLFNPWALIALKETGHCIVNLPEAFFDMDYPGQYFRRLKSVSMTIPCVTGPYTSVNCTLTLLNSKVRIDNLASTNQDYASDSHFITNYAATQSIATSTAQNDSGMFEVNFRDERYLPFEGAGAVSNWQIDMPPDCNAFDFETISDVVINLKYTSRYGGDKLRDVAMRAALLPPPPVQTVSANGVRFRGQPNLTRLFSLKHEFSTDWHKFLNPPDTATSQNMQIGLSIERFPFQYRGRKIQVSRVELFLKFKDIHDPTYEHDGTPLGDYVFFGAALKVSVNPPGGPVANGTLNSSPSLLDGLPYASITLPTTNTPGLGAWLLTAQNADIQKIARTLRNVAGEHLNPAVIDDIMLACHYSAT